ncbi:MAG TPA: signal peptidase II [Polyangiaceae bacterium]
MSDPVQSAPPGAPPAGPDLAKPVEPAPATAPVIEAPPAAPVIEAPHAAAPIIEAPQLSAPLPEGAPLPVSAPLSSAGPASTQPSEAPLGDRPTFLFFGIIASVSLLADVLTKAWAEIVLSRRPFDDPSIVLIQKHLTFTIAYNKGGAWGLLQDAPESVRRPFFFAVSVLAVLFIVSLYSKIGRSQRALAWGLPLVLGGALGNLSDRVTRSSVIDFIDYRADWVLSMNRAILKLVPNWGVTDHWPTFNVADIAICVGVGLMAVDMFTSRRAPERAAPLGPAVGA